MIDLPPEHLEKVRRILTERVPGMQAYAFGSRVTGKAKPYSDLDIALAGPIEPLRLADLREAFEESDLPLRVDVIDLSAVSPAFRDAIRAQLTGI